MGFSWKHCICLGGQITNESFFDEFIAKFARVMEDTKPGDEIVLMINSSGGDTHTAMGIYDLITDSDRNFIGIVAGRAESAASLILEACGQRLMTKTSRLTIHQTRIGIGNVTIKEAEAALVSYQEMDDVFDQAMAARSDNEIEDIRKWRENAGYFDADEALRLGFIDEIYSVE